MPAPATPGPADDGRSRQQLLVGAGAMIAIGLLGLVAVLAVVLRDRGPDGEVTAPSLPGDDTVAPSGDDDGAPVSNDLAPLAMLQDSTTTTVSPDAPASSSTTARRVTVPDLVGLDVEVAGQRLDDLDIGVLVVGRVSPGSVPGTVIQQTPAAGSSVVLPVSVTLFIPRSATLPFMVGRPADTVCLQLAALGVTCEQTLGFDDRVPSGAVVATDPVEGSGYQEGSTVRLRVSRGPLVEVTIPQVAGRSEDEARAALDDAGFLAVTAVTVYSAGVESGRAVETDPPAGTRLAADQPVTIRMSMGAAPRVTVPTLIGLDRRAAEGALAGAQLSATFASRDLPAGDPNVGRVVAADPAPGTEVAAGSTVTVTIGREAGSAETTTSTVSGG
jgi:serine/threonine-protein kinase